LSQGALQRGALADDFFEIEFAANFFLEIKFFLGQLVLQGVNFFERERILHGDGNLRADLLEQLEIVRSEGVHTPAGEIERAERLSMRIERNASDGLDAFAAQDFYDFAGVAIHFRAAHQQRLSGRNSVAGGRNVARNGDFLFEEILMAGKIKSVDFEQPGRRILEGQAGVIVLNHALESGDDAAEKLGELAIGDQNVVDF